MIEWVDVALKEWADEMKGSVVNLNYPSETLEYKMMKFGPDSLVRDGNGGRNESIYISDAVLKTESVLLAMCRYDRMLLIVAYTCMVSRESQARIFSDRIGYTVSRRQFMIDLDNAQSWYCGYLKVERKINNNKLLTLAPKKVYKSVHAARVVRKS